MHVDNRKFENYATMTKDPSEKASFVNKSYSKHGDSTPRHRVQEH